MPKAIEGAALIGAVIGAEVLTAMYDPALTVNPAFQKAMFAIGMMGVSMEAGAIASALTSNRGMNITTRQAAANRQIIYGQQRVGGVTIFKSTTGSHKDQLNYVIVIAGHVCDSLVNLYLDGRAVHWAGGVGNVTRNGVNFGGAADGNSYTGPNGVQYNFGGSVYAEAKFGDQLEGDVIGGLTANDPTWAADANGNSPWVAGCTYIYLKVENNPSLFPGEPEVRITVNGKNDIWDPRTQTSGFTTNWALIAADIISDTQFGLGDNTVNQLNLIAAANVCDEQVEFVGAGGGTEARYTCNYHFDTGTAPGDALAAIMPGAAGGYSLIGGEHYLWPAYWQGPSFTFGESDLTATFQWKPYRSVPDLINCVNGTYIAPTFPYNIAGDEYDRNGFYNGQAQDNFAFGFQPTNFPQYAQDELHGYPSDEWLTADGGHQHPLELSLQSVLSVGQAQRLAKIALMRNRFQGVGTLEMRLAAYQMQPKNVFDFNFPYLGWSNKVLEVSGASLSVTEDQDSGAQSIRASFNVNETDPSIYEWSTIEELTVYAVPALPSQTPLTPAPPTNMALTSGPDTAIVQPDGSLESVIRVTFDTPLDNLTVQIQVQYQQVGASTWLSAPAIDISLNVGLISGVIAGETYNVQIRSTRATGVSSEWVQILNYTVSTTPSFLGTLGGLIPQMEPIIGLMPAQAGADQTALQPIVYSASSESIVPNGNFVLGTTQGWQLVEFTYGSDSFGPRIYSNGQPNASAGSPAFQVTPGNKYRMVYKAYGNGGSGGDYLRVAWQSTQGQVVVPGTGNYFDFFANGTVSTSGPFAQAFDWVAPAGANYASMWVYAAYNGLTSDVALQYVQCLPYVAVSQWGADVTSSNTSADTSSVDGIPASTIAQVIPTGYKLFINSGSRTYSIQAI
jgi:hypothetical protein